MKLRKSRRSGASKYAILGVLTFGDMSGYDIRNVMNGSLAYFWSESFGQIYPGLKELVGEGLVKPVKSAAKSGRERQVYSITERGRKQLRAWLSETPHPQPPRSELLFKLFFGRELPIPTSRAHVEAARQRTLRDLAEFDRVESELRAARSEHPGFPFWILTIDYGREQAKGIIRWCDHALEVLNRLENSKQNGSTRK